MWKTIACIALLAFVACKSSTPTATGSGSAVASGATAAPGSGSAVGSSAGSAAVTAAPDAATAPPEPAIDPTTRAKTVIDKQVAAVKAGDNAALLAMFAPGAEILEGDPTLVDKSTDVVSRIALLTPHKSLEKLTVKSLVAGGTDAVVWLDGELEVALASSEEGGARSVTHPVRVVELLDRASGWKIATASFAQAAPAAQLGSSAGAVPNPTDAGPLSKLLPAPADIASSLGTDPNVFVLGTEVGERAIGPDAAKKLLGQWSKLKFTIEEQDKVHEVHTSAWGYAIANVNMVKGSSDPYRMTGLIIGVPTASGGWSVVAVVYDAI